MAQTFLPKNGSLAHFTILIIENDLCVCVRVNVCNKTCSLACLFTPLGHTIKQTFRRRYQWSSRFFLCIRNVHAYTDTHTNILHITHSIIGIYTEIANEFYKWTMNESTQSSMATKK